MALVILNYSRSEEINYVQKITFYWSITFAHKCCSCVLERPGDVSDLVGVRASNGESELRNRGYRFIKTSKGDDRSYSNWWKASTRTCLTVATYNGRYDSIISAPFPDCNQNSGGNNGGNWGGNNGGQVNPPSWARGTFYGTGPGGEQITLTISNNGSNAANVNGGMSYGTFTPGDYLNLGGPPRR